MDSQNDSSFFQFEEDLEPETQQADTYSFAKRSTDGSKAIIEIDLVTCRVSVNRYSQ